MRNYDYSQILEHYKKLLKKYGNNNLGLGWNSKKKKYLKV